MWRRRVNGVQQQRATMSSAPCQPLPLLCHPHALTHTHTNAHAHTGSSCSVDAYKVMRLLDAFPCSTSSSADAALKAVAPPCTHTHTNTDTHTRTRNARRLRNGAQIVVWQANGDMDQAAALLQKQRSDHRG
jgi:hypothetical protein